MLPPITIAIRSVAQYRNFLILFIDYLLFVISLLCVGTQVSRLRLSQVGCLRTDILPQR